MRYLVWNDERRRDLKVAIVIANNVKIAAECFIRDYYQGAKSITVCVRDITSTEEDHKFNMQLGWSMEEACHDES